MSKRERIEDYFADGDEFEDTLHEAIENADGRAIDFCIQIKKTWEHYGLAGYMSESQYQRLCTLAGM